MIRLAASIGCPCGIGPEVSVAAAAKVASRRRDARVLLVGDLGALRAAARVRGVDARRLVLVRSAAEAWLLPARAIGVFQPTRALPARDRRPGRPTRASGAAQLAWIDAACNLVASGDADALVTGPVSKDAIARSGAPGSRDFLGHTEHLARRLGAPEVVMAFYGRPSPRRAVARPTALVTALVTTHVPIKDVPRAITREGVARATFWLAHLLVATGTRRPTIAVSGLNPHAGESGLLGREEQRIIAPGIERARTRVAKAKLGARIVGPVPAESAFRLAAAGDYDGVVAMFHDQATIAMKLASFAEAVNVSLGLPIVRTSVDHGTAYDRAGKGTADPRGMLAAMELAGTLASVT